MKLYVGRVVMKVMEWMRLLGEKVKGKKKGGPRTMLYRISMFER